MGFVSDIRNLDLRQRRQGGEALMARRDVQRDRDKTASPEYNTLRVPRRQAQPKSSRHHLRPAAPGAWPGVLPDGVREHVDAFEGGWRRTRFGGRKWGRVQRRSWSNQFARLRMANGPVFYLNESFFNSDAKAITGRRRQRSGGG